MSRIYIIHENNQWLEPLRSALDGLDLPFEEWFLDGGSLDLDRPPPEGVFYNRMSASSHARGHRYAVEYTACVLAWLEGHGRRVINTSRALQLEVSKIAQYAALNAFGVRTPRTIGAVGPDQIVEAAKRFDGPVITKPNRGGKGLGVRLFRDPEALENYVAGPSCEPSLDGITLVQEYIEAPEGFITRVEFVGGTFLYAVRVDTSQGFELCPADVCSAGDAFCPTGDASEARFRILDGLDHAFVERYANFLKANGIHIAGVEFVMDQEARAYTYDVNTNTNYNAEAEAKAGISGMRSIAAYLGRELAALYRSRGTRFVRMRRQTPAPCSQRVVKSPL